jgi:hypothetical protein
VSFRSASSARRLFAWRDAELARLAQLLQDAVLAWAAQWGLPPPWQGPVSCACVSAPGAGAQWDCMGGEAGASVWRAPGDATADALAQALMRATCVTPLLRALGEACRHDLEGRLLSALRLKGDGSGSAPAPGFPGRWSGNLVATLPGGVQWLIDAAVAERLLRPARAMRPGSGALVPVGKAFADMAFPLQVRLEGCDVDLGTLQDLQPGDVLRLRHRLDLPASVCADDGDLLFKGFLARSRGRKAVELAPIH